jgi:hypothetical protein
MKSANSGDFDPRAVLSMRLMRAFLPGLFLKSRQVRPILMGLSIKNPDPVGRLNLAPRKLKLAFLHPIR